MSPRICWWLKTGKVITKMTPKVRISFFRHHFIPTILNSDTPFIHWTQSYICSAKIRGRTISSRRGWVKSRGWYFGRGHQVRNDTFAIMSVAFMWQKIIRPLRVLRIYRLIDDPTAGFAALFGSGKRKPVSRCARQRSFLSLEYQLVVLDTDWRFWIHLCDDAATRQTAVAPRAYIEQLSLS